MHTEWVRNHAIQQLHVTSWAAVLDEIESWRQTKSKIPLNLSFNRQILKIQGF